MLKRRAPAWIVAPAFAIVAIFIAGFFHHGGRAEASARRPGAAIAIDGLRTHEFVRAADMNESGGLASADMAFSGHAAPPLKMKSMLAVPANLYRRSGEVACRVESVVKTYEGIDQRLKDFGGEITEMEITGNDDGRRGVLRCTVSTDKFNPCITYLRGIGTVLSERITASSRPRGKSHVAPAVDDEVDFRELSLVTIHIMDERAAKQVSESGGLLAASFHRSASHGLAGLAVIVEGLGWIAPYVLVAAMLAAPFLISRAIRRRGAVAAPQAV